MSVRAQAKSQAAGALALLAFGTGLVPCAVQAQAPAAPDAERILLLTGQQAPLCPNGGCHSPICDDPKVATITANSGVLEAHEPGVTLCSLDYGYGRRLVFRVTVRPLPAPPPPEALEQAPAVEPPPPPSARTPEPAPRKAAPAPAPRASDDEALYQWTAEDGSLQFGHLSDVPPAQRKAARPVTAELSVVPAAPQRSASLPPPPPPPPAALSEPRPVPAPDPLPDGIDGR
ncbi:MAG TPA: hypothetical protein VK454_05420 [Myxococcaceae bacterium]|nr:hypothetical protein [Myxococcaceae bacterium]